MSRTIRKAFLLLLACALIGPPAAAATYRWSGVERVVAMSDPHGAFDSMVTTLKHAGIVDESGKWAGGSSHLVITGDLLDRGADSRRIMDFVMRLEGEAPAAGGMVHLTLGNHEVMNLVGDLRYVAREEFAAFADEETAEERERWFQKLLSTRRVQTEGQVDEATLRAEFDRDRPPGFYGHRKAFGGEGRYGKWLLEKPLMVVINDTAYVHGGMPEIVGELGLDGLNTTLGAQVSDYVAALDVVSEAGLIDPAVNFYDHGGIAAGIATDVTIPAELIEALETIASLNDSEVHASSSPLWYRGTVGCSVLTEGDVIASALESVGASRVVIGHTPTVSRRVLTRFDGRVIEIDTGMLNSAYRGEGYALILEGDRLAVAQERSAELTAPVEHPRRVGGRADDLTAEALADLLANGSIVASATDAAGRTVVEVSRNGSTVSALFSPSPRRKGREPELAAYRLDRMIDLELVPVTVTREVNGERGTLQFLPKNARDESYRASTGQGGGAWCSLPRQWNSLYIFDALIYNEGRLPTTMMYSTGNWQLLSVGHGSAFGTRDRRPAYMAELPLELTSTWVEALRSLSDERLAENLADVLSQRQIEAIADRRDMLLDETGN